jgi:hypothetical protein
MQQHDVLCTGVLCDGHVTGVADDANDLRVGRGRETDSALAHGTSRALHDHPAAGDWPCHVHRTVRGDAGNAETGTLLEGHAVWQWNRLRSRKDAVLGGGAKGTVRLRAEAPHALADPCGSDPFADLVDDPCAIAVGNDPAVRHAIAVLVAPLLDVAGIDPGGGDLDAHLTWPTRGIGHLPDDEDIARRPLSLVPCRPHQSLSLAMSRSSALRCSSPGRSLLNRTDVDTMRACPSRTKACRWAILKSTRTAISPR